MKFTVHSALTAIFLALTFASPAGAGPLEDLEDANEAVSRHDYATAIPLYRSLAAKGNAAAMTALGEFYYMGQGVKKDWVESAKWFSKALEAGDERAAISLGDIGRSWEPNHNHTEVPAVVYELIEKAAKRGNVVAQYSLGFMNYPLYAGRLGPRKGNLQEALVWYRRAAEQGDVDSEVALGVAYEGGIGVPQNYVEAHKWYNLAGATTTLASLRADIGKRRDALARKMTSSQIDEAQRLAREWRPAKPSP
jgi:TPR repeat protein